MTNALNIECDNRDAKGDILCEELIANVNRETPFVYLRYGDGEFNSIHNRRGRNADKCGFFGDTLGVALTDILREVSGAESKDGVLFGGWWDERYIDFLKSNGYLETIPWVSAGTFYYEVETLRALRLIHAMRDYKRKTVLVGCNRIVRAASVIGAEFIEVPERDCWLEHENVHKLCLDKMEDGTLFVYCCGMMSNVLAWDLWKRNSNTLQLNFGHIFDACLGYRRRQWLKRPNAARDVLREHYVPLFDLTNQ